MPTLVLRALFVVAVCGAPARAEDIVIRIAPEQTRVAWTLGATLHAVRGTFAAKAGTLRFDSRSNEVNGKLEIDLLSGTSGNAKRDERMRDDVLETAKFPLATFTSRSFAGRFDADGASHILLAGTLLIHGAEHDLTLPLDVVAHAGQIQSGVTRFTIPYVAWGMRDPSVFLLRVSDHVDVEVRIAERTPSAVTELRPASTRSVGTEAAARAGR